MLCASDISPVAGLAFAPYAAITTSAELDISGLAIVA